LAKPRTAGVIQIGRRYRCAAKGRLSFYLILFESKRDETRAASRPSADQRRYLVGSGHSQAVSPFITAEDADSISFRICFASFCAKKLGFC